MTSPSFAPAAPRWLWAYDAALTVGGAAWLPYYLLIRRPGHPGIGQRCGWYPSMLRARLAQGEPPIWIHAVSVGEVMAALRLLAGLRARVARGRWVLSTTTPTGQQVARERAAASDTVLYAPWDVSPCVRRAITAIRPRAFIGLETELWPNLFLRLQAAGVPIAVVNGRLSARSFPRYWAIRRGLRSTLAAVRVWAMQTPLDAQRILDLGVDPGRVHVTGNLKADVAPLRPTVARLEALQRLLGINGQTSVWVAGSTHAGEEEVLLRAYAQVRIEYPTLRLLIAPRHPERVREVETVVQRAGLTPRRRSQADGVPWDGTTVLILDTLGELSTLYAVADLVFVGGSLVPHGGHNLLEPAQWAKAIMTGPFTQNFQSVTELLRGAEALQVVDNAETMAAVVRRWLAHLELRRDVGARARAAIVTQAGSTAKTIALLTDQFGPAVWAV